MPKKSAAKANTTSTFTHNDSPSKNHNNVLVISLSILLIIRLGAIVYLAYNYHQITQPLEESNIITTDVNQNPNISPTNAADITIQPLYQVITVNDSSEWLSLESDIVKTTDIRFDYPGVLVVEENMREFDAGKYYFFPDLSTRDQFASCVAKLSLCTPFMWALTSMNVGAE